MATTKTLTLDNIVSLCNITATSCNTSVHSISLELHNNPGHVFIRFNILPTELYDFDYVHAKLKPPLNHCAALTNSLLHQLNNYMHDIDINQDGLALVTEQLCSTIDTYARRINYS